MLDIARLDELPRTELIELGRRYGIERPERMTRVELRDELVRVTVTDEHLRHRTRGWFGVARDLVASVVEAGLHMPDAAKVIRGDETAVELQVKRPPVATVTLAEIYAAQGHVRRALKMLDQVLIAEPDHDVAQLLKEQFKERLGRASRGEDTSQAPPSRPTPRTPLDGLLGERLGAEADTPAADDVVDEAEPPESGEVAVQSTGSTPEPPSRDQPDWHETAADSGVLDEPPEPESESAPDASEAGAALEARIPDLGVALRKTAFATEPEVSAAAGETGASLKDVSPAPDFAADLLVTVHDTRATIAYWELTTRSIERGRALDPEGHLALRMVSVRPGWDGAECIESEARVHGPVGREALVLPAGSHYPRVAIGWRFGAGFLPLAVAVEVGPSGEIEFQPPALAEDRIEMARQRALSAAGPS